MLVAWKSARASIEDAETLIVQGSFGWIGFFGNFDPYLKVIAADISEADAFTGVFVN